MSDEPADPVVTGRARTPADVEELDPAYFRERTELAWVRTSLSFAGLGVATLRTVPVAGVLMLVIAAAVWLIGHFSPPYGPTSGRVRGIRLRLVTGAIVAVSLVALVTALLGGAGGGGPLDLG